MKYIDIPENKLYQYPRYNLYFEKQDGLVGIYWQNDDEIFEQYSVENKFDNIEILKERGIAEKIQHDENLTFDDGIPQKEHEVEYSEVIERQIEELKRKLGWVESKYCYVLIRYDNGKACIKELVNNKIIFNNFEFKHYSFYSDFDDGLIQLCDSEDKCYSLLSLRYGYIFGPYHYKKIDIRDCGVILDCRFYVGHFGKVVDAANFEQYMRKYLVLFNREKEICYVMVDGFNTLLLQLPKKNSEEGEVCEIYSIEIGNNLYEFDGKTKELYVEEEYESNYEWTDEDAWDVMTEGDSGDYPGPGWDMERFGY